MIIKMKWKNAMKKKIFYTIVFTLLICLMFSSKSAYAAAKKNASVLILGNSLTWRGDNSTMKHLRNLSKAGGDKLSLTYVVDGLASMERYADPKDELGKQARRAISRKKWNIVILQERTNQALAHQWSFGKNTKILCALIRKKIPNVRIILECTWGYDRDKTIDDIVYKKKEQQAILDDRYTRAGIAMQADVLYSGDAFAQYRKIKNPLQIYGPDKNHASNAGCYLAACCLYTEIFNKSAEGNHYYGGVKKDHAKIMQSIASEKQKHTGRITGTIR